MFGLGKLLYVIILSVNGIAVLSEDRFLKRIGWSSAAPNQFQQPYGIQTNGSDQSIKTRLITLISAIRTLLRLPLIFINTLIILYELILGWCMLSCYRWFPSILRITLRILYHRYHVIYINSSPFRQSLSFAFWCQINIHEIKVVKTSSLFHYLHFHIFLSFPAWFPVPPATRSLANGP